MTSNKSHRLLTSLLLALLSGLLLRVAGARRGKMFGLTCTTSTFHADANKYSCINDVLNYYQLTTMQSALYATGKQWIATGQPAGITFFVPTNAAWAAMLARENMTAQQMYNNPSALGDLIDAHIVPTAFLCSTLKLNVALQTEYAPQSITPMTLPG